MEKKIKDEDKVLIGVAVAGAGVLGYLWWKNKKKKDESLLLAAKKEEDKPVTKKAPVKITSAPFDKSKVLMKGSKGQEVRELQRLLGVPIDGDFGPITLRALRAKKGVSSISIANYASVSNKPNRAKPTAFVLPKVGQKLMAIANDTSIWNAQKNVDNTYINTGVKPFLNSSFDFGDHIGTFITVNKSGKYLINREGVYYFVNRENVKPY